MKTNRFKGPKFGNYIAVYFFIGLIILGIILFSISHILIQRLQQEYNKTSTAYAIVLSLLISSKIPQVTDKLTGDIGDTMAFPAVITDPEGKYIDSKNLSGDISPTTEIGREKLQGILENMDRDNKPIPIISYRMNPNTKKLEEVVEYYFHYQDPEVVKWLRLLPLGQVVLIAVFFLIGIIAYRNMKRDEQIALWVGMAKETAHQIGTPISSLIGWIELLKDYDFKNISDEEGREISKAFESMTQDIQRLKRISERFASIGARPTLIEYNLEDIVKKAVQYCRQRLSLEEHGIELVEVYKKDTRVLANTEQISWCIENLFRNSIRSLEGKKGGVISLTVDSNENGDRASIIVEDNGMGMSGRIMKHIFDLGFTTKKTGWGMGLSLVKRIIEDYHRGEIKVESREGEGSKFTLILPGIE